MQKKRLAIAVLLFWIFHPLLTIAQETSPPVAPPLIITEIAAFEPNDTEWIEIYNKGDTPIDATGWKFFEDETNHGLSAFRGDFLLDPNEYAVIANKADLVAQKYPEFTGTLLDSSWSSLKEEGEEIGIKDADGNFLEQFIYPQTGSSTSLERIDINVAAIEPTNWTPNPTAHSIGKAREVPEIPEPVEVGTSTESSIIPLEGSSSPPVEIAPPEPPSSEPPSIPPSPPPPPSPPSNQPPQAIIQIQSGSLIAQGETTINFDGRSSFDPDGNSLNFFWDFGDSTTSDSANPSFHKYGVPGFYTVALTVTDPSGASGKNYEYVQVLNKPALQTPAPIAPSHPPAAAPAPTMQYTPGSQFSLPAMLPKGTMEVRGYFVFVVPENSPAIPAIKPAIKQKIDIQENPKKKTKKGTSKKPAYKNGGRSSDIKITEIFPYPAQASQEWIEIQNTGNKTINIGNWMLADSKKTSSPYLIPDSIELKPMAYAVFQKNATRINLNNDRDTVFLADFEGNVVDSVAYEDAQKDFSYALIHMKDGSDLVASADTMAPRQKEELWEWIDEPTPGEKNPVFEKIEDHASRLIAGGGGGEVTMKIETEDTLDPLAAKILTNDFRPAPALEPTILDAPKNDQENSWVLWAALGVLAVSFLLNGIPLFLALKKWRASRGERLPEIAGFQRDENPKPETKSDQRRFF